MDSTIVVSLISLLGTLIGTFAGILTGSSLTKHRVTQLEKKVDELGELVEKTIRLEGRVTELEHDIRDIKKGVIK